jgi:hypothetical protein
MKGTEGTAMRFHTTLQLDGKTATGLVVPEEVIARLNAGKRPRVEVTINGYTFQTTMGVIRGGARVPVSAERREAARLAAGDDVDVEIEVAA